MSPLQKPNGESWREWLLSDLQLARAEGFRLSSSHSHDHVVRDEPPSVKLVYFVLKEEGAQNREDITDGTTLPERTVSYALSRLEHASVVERTPDLKDARRKIYRLRD